MLLTELGKSMLGLGEVHRVPVATEGCLVAAEQRNCDLSARCRSTDRVEDAQHWGRVGEGSRLRGWGAAEGMHVEA